ncbi:MAG: hypothetical protein KC609_07515 [Myxococcales bacterium]|nr:hypothetical protein [Myxococcales bacterium]
MSAQWADALTAALHDAGDHLGEALIERFEDGSLNVGVPIGESPWIVWLSPWESWLVAMCPARWGHGLERRDFARAMHANRAPSLWRWAAHDNYLCLRAELPLEVGDPIAFRTLVIQLFSDLRAIVGRFALGEQPDIGRPRDPTEEGR